MLRGVRTDLVTLSFDCVSAAGVVLAGVAVAADSVAGVSVAGVSVAGCVGQGQKGNAGHDADLRAGVGVCV